MWLGSDEGYPVQSVQVDALAREKRQDIKRCRLGKNATECRGSLTLLGKSVRVSITSCPINADAHIDTLISH